MKKQILIFIYLVFCSLAWGQNTASPSVYSSGGSASGSFSTNTIQWTIGETIIGAGQTGSNKVTNGFNQTISVTVGIEELQSLETLGVKVFPNPVSNSLSVELTGNNLYKAVVYNIEGKIVSTSILKTGTNQVDCSTLSAGNYLLKFSNNENTISKTVKIQKHLN
jgi:hypothetical protein